MQPKITGEQTDLAIGDISNADWVFVSVVGPATHNVAAITDLIVVDASGGPVTINLQSVTVPRRHPLNIKRIDSSINTISVVGAGSPAETIDGSSSIEFANQYDNLTIMHNGTEWLIL